MRSNASGGTPSGTNSPRRPRRARGGNARTDVCGVRPRSRFTLPELRVPRMLGQRGAGTPAAMDHRSHRRRHLQWPLRRRTSGCHPRIQVRRTTIARGSAGQADARQRARAARRLRLRGPCAAASVAPAAPRFQPGPRIVDAVVVLVDDVRTTGATVDECARVLLRAGAREVRALTLAIA